MIALSNIVVKKFNKIILKNINFNLNKGQIVSIIGKNGTGKSTICKLLIGSIKPYSGNIIREPNIKISYVPQIFDRSILIPLKVKRFLLLGQQYKNSQEYKKYLYYLIKDLCIENILNTNLNNLSGGEMQKILLIRALLRKPDLLILDEAFSFLDLASLLNLYKIIFSEQKKHNFTVLLVSHDISFVMKQTDYIICLRNGTIHCHGNYNDIKDISYIKNLIGLYVHKNDLELI